MDFRDRRLDKNGIACMQLLDASIRAAQRGGVCKTIARCGADGSRSPRLALQRISSVMVMFSPVDARMT
jgi:hypothetical protein